MKYFFALVICLFSLSASNAQDDFKMPPKVFPVLKENYVSVNSDEVFTVGKVTGDIGKAEALYLPKPFYPGEAKKDAAEGKIYVQITIDETGNVASARSTDGHSALRKIAEESARSSKFRAPKVDNQPVKTEGWLVYNFEIERSNWIKTGYDLAFLHTSLVNQKLALAGIKKNFKPDWTTENELLAKLGEFVAQMPPEPFDDTPTLATQTVNKNGSLVRMKTFSRPLPMRPEPNPEQIAVTQNLIASLQSRLATDAIANWQFNLAFAILQDVYPRLNPNEPNRSPESLKRLLQTAPPNLPAEYTDELKNLITIIENKTQKDLLDETGTSIIKLQKLK